MIHVAIDARLPDKGQGGVQQVIRSLAEGFRTAKQSDIRRSWIVFRGTTWWQNILPQDDELIIVKPPFGKVSISVAKIAPRLISRAYPLLSRFFSQKPRFDKILNDLKVDLIHMPFQDGFVTKIPFIYHPHDLQHEYFPQNFVPSQIKHRNTVWKSLAINSKMILVASPLVKSDLNQFWNICNDKIRVVPIPPPTRSLNAEHTSSFSLANYIIYPAVFWPHKNHKTLIEALNLIRLAGSDIQLVLTGSSGPTLKPIEKKINEYGLNGSVRILGHVPEAFLACLIRDANAVVIPSLHEAMSLTAWDAINLDTPVVISDIPSFRIQFPDYKWTFEPMNYSHLAQLILDISGMRKHQSAEINALLRKISVPKLEDFAEAIEEIYRSAL